MYFTRIEWKNIFSYGEHVLCIEYDREGKLILLKGHSGAGKTAILSLPALILYGKLEKTNKTSIANRINKNGWVRGTIVKNNHTYVIERKFTPNGLTVYKDDENIENYGTKDAQLYIDTEIIEIPLTAFNNMISISMKKFKSFLAMSPADRKLIIDRVFNLEIVNTVFESIKKDMREIGLSINSDNTTLYLLSLTILNANLELIRILNNMKVAESESQIEENNKLILSYNEKLSKLNTAYTQVITLQTLINNDIAIVKKGQIENEMNISLVNEKLYLYTLEKCPTCGTSFTSESFNDLRIKLNDYKVEKEQIRLKLNEKLQELNTNITQVNDYLTKITNAIYSINTEINNISNKNIVIQETLKASGEFLGVKNIIDKTQEQVEIIKKSLDEKNQKMLDLQNLSVVYSIEGVKQKVINNYLPLLNKEIELNLDLLNFPYLVSFDSKFEPTVTDLGINVPIDTISDGEMTRVDIVVLCALFKLLKRRYPSINILSIDELVSFLDVYNSQILLKFISDFAKQMNLNVFVVSHVSIDTECFDKCIEVSRNENSFSSIRIEDLMI